MKNSRRTFLSKLSATAVSFGLMGGIEHQAFGGPSLSANATGSAFAGEKKFVPVMLTPFTRDMRIDYDGLSALMDYYLQAGAKGFFANCLSSEMYDLTDDERLDLVRHVVKRTRGKVPVVATGSFGNSLVDRIGYARKMHDTGVHAVILITSHLADETDNDQTLIGHLDQFLAGTKDIPLGTYECPSPYKRILTPEVWKYLLSTGKLVYHKDTTIDPAKIEVKLAMAKGNPVEFYDAHTPNTLSSLRKGAKGMSCIAGNFYPEIFAWICQHIDEAGRQEDLRWLQAELTRVDSIISKNYSLSAKYFLRKRGVPMEINSRKNTGPLSVEQQRVLDQVFKDVEGWHDRLGIV